MQVLAFVHYMCNMQVEERSHKIWGGEEGLEVEHQNKIERREKKKEKKYAKEIKGKCLFHGQETVLYYYSVG